MRLCAAFEQAESWGQKDFLCRFTDTFDVGQSLAMGSGLQSQLDEAMLAKLRQQFSISFKFESVHSVHATPARLMGRISRST